VDKIGERYLLKHDIVVCGSSCLWNDVLASRLLTEHGSVLFVVPWQIPQLIYWV